MDPEEPDENKETALGNYEVLPDKDSFRNIEKPEKNKFAVEKSDIREIDSYLQSIGIILLYTTSGISRTVQGPALLDIQQQAGIELSDFGKVFAICSLALPVGNAICGWVTNMIKRTRTLIFFIGCIGLMSAVSQGMIPFSRNLKELTFTSLWAEFVQGLLDSGCCLGTLKIWCQNPKKSDSFFSATAMAYGLGTLLSPLVSSLFLDDSLEQIKNEKNSVTNLQKMFLSLQIFTISSSLLMLISGLFSSKDKLIYKENFESDANMEPLMDKKEELEIEDKRKIRKEENSFAASRFIVLIIMNIFQFCIFGVHMNMSNFLPAYGIKSELALGKRDGAMLAFVFNTSVVFIRFCSTFFILWISPFKIILTSFVVLSLGLAANMARVFICPDTFWVMILCTIVIGVGIGSLFSAGISWTKRTIPDASTKEETFILISTALGSQFFRIPVAPFIEHFPNILFYVMIGSVSLVILLFSFAKHLAWRMDLKSLNKQTIPNLT